METKKRSKVIPIILIIFSIIGLLSSVYLTKVHYKESNDPSVCDINDRVSCTLLAQSTYAKVGPIPIAILGIFGYILLLTLAILHLTNKNNNPKLTKRLKLTQLSLTAIAMLFTIYLILIEFIVKIFCLGCLVSQISITVMFIASYIYYFKQ